MKIRELAFKILIEIIIDGGYSNIVLNRGLNEHDLKEPNRGFLTMIVHGTLQNYFILDYQIEQIISRPLKPKMKILLIMGLYQMRFMTKVPIYAVINETVEMARSLDGEGSASFANGVLRTLSRQTVPFNIDKLTNHYDFLSLKYNTPRFIVKMWRKQFGDEVTIKILKANQKIAPLSLRVDLNKISIEELTKNLEFLPGNISKWAVIYDGKKKISDLEEFKKGWIAAQDEAGQLVAPLLELKSDDRILDMCAAPGSKTVHMASILKNTGMITAIDIHPHRTKLLNDNISRLGYQNVECITCDALELESKYPPKSFNKILLDAPYSGLGVTRRKPDILLRIVPEDIDSLVELQKKLLETAYRLLEVNGVLVYSTCTINKKENEWMIENFLRNHPDARLESQQTIFPFQHDSDGFYMAKVMKND